MLTYVLVWIITLGSLGLYLAAYLFPEVHRKNDFLWGGVGLFYALILWANAKTMPSGLLMGQIASVSLIIWLGQETLRQRQRLAPANTLLPTPGSVSDRLRGLVIQAWRLIEPLATTLLGGITKLLEKPQKAKISEIEVGIREETKPSFFTQLTDPLSNLPGNLTGVFKSGTKSPVTINTVTVKATPATDDVEEDNATPIVTEKEAGEGTQQQGESPTPPEASAGVEPPTGVETSPTKLDDPPAKENPIKPVDTTDAKRIDSESSTQPSTAPTELGVTSEEAAKAFDAGVAKPITTNIDTQDISQSIPQPPTTTTELGATPVEVDAVTEATPLVQDEIATTVDPVDPQSPLLPIDTTPVAADAVTEATPFVQVEIATTVDPVEPQSPLPPIDTRADNPAQTAEAVEAAVPSVEVLLTETAPELPEMHRQQDVTTVSTENTEFKEQSSETPQTAEGVGATVPPVEIPPVKTSPQLPEIYRYKGETASTAGNIEIKEPSSNTAATSVEPDSTQPTVTGGELQPETKPEEWTTADPLA